MTNAENAAPTIDAVAVAAAARLNRPVSNVSVFEQGMNPVYHVSFEKGSDAVVKTGTVTEGTKLMSGPVLIERIHQETDLPVPTVLSVVPNGDEYLEQAYFLMEYIDGQRKIDATELSYSVHKQLVREAGCHLAKIHGISYDGPYGRLHAENDELFVERSTDTWSATVASIGDWYLHADPIPFEDLKPIFEDVTTGISAVIDEDEVDKSILYRDYHLKNLILEPDFGGNSVVRAILDFNYRPVGDAAYDVAIAESYLIDTPIKGAEKKESLRNVFRESYVTTRGVKRGEFFDERYPYYQIMATFDYLNNMEYWSQFGWEMDTEAFTQRVKTVIRERYEEIKPRS